MSASLHHTHASNSDHKHDHGDHDHHDCRQYLGNLSDYVDGELSTDLCREIEAHMSECENCRVVVNTLSKTVSLYHQLPSPELPNTVRDRLFKVLNLEDYDTSSRTE